MASTSSSSESIEDSGPVESTEDDADKTEVRKYRLSPTRNQLTGFYGAGASTHTETLAYAC